MRIAFSGCQNTGKTTLINNFLEVWKGYKKPEKSYRDVLVEKGLPHSSETTTETQMAVLNFMLDQLQATSAGDKIVFDRCPLDNLAYTLWAHMKGIEGFDKPFVDKTILLTKEAMRSLDIIFLLNRDESIAIVNDGVRDTDEVYIAEIDNIFNALFDQYELHYDKDTFFPKDDSPGLIKLPAHPQQRIDAIADYINPDGDIYGDEHSILNPNNLNELEVLVKQQQAAHESDKKEREMWEKFGNLGNLKL